MSGFLPDLDNDNRLANKAATATAGWTFQALFSEITTSTLASAYCKDVDQVDLPYTLKFYDVGDVELTTQPNLDSSCVKTVFTLSLAHDYELISGHLRYTTVPTTDCRLWIHAGAVQLGTAYTKTFVSGMNMKLVNDGFDADGRSSKMLLLDSGIGYPTNEMQFLILHNAGAKHEITFSMEYYKA